MLSSWGDASALVEWFLTIEPPHRPFELCQGVTVARMDIRWATGSLWGGSIRSEAAGPSNAGGGKGTDHEISEP